MVFGVTRNLHVSSVKIYERIPPYSIVVTLKSKSTVLLDSFHREKKTTAPQTLLMERLSLKLGPMPNQPAILVLLLVVRRPSVDS